MEGSTPNPKLSPTERKAAQDRDPSGSLRSPCRRVGPKAVRGAKYEVGFGCQFCWCVYLNLRFLGMLVRVRIGCPTCRTIHKKLHVWRNLKKGVLFCGPYGKHSVFYCTSLRCITGTSFSENAHIHTAHSAKASNA